MTAASAVVTQYGHLDSGHRTYAQPLADVPHCTWASGCNGHTSSRAIGDGGGLEFVAAFRGGGGDSDFMGPITDANNLTRFSCANLSSSSFVGVVGGGGDGDVDSGTTVPFTLGSPGFLSSGSNRLVVYLEVLRLVVVVVAQT